MTINRVAIVGLVLTALGGAVATVAQPSPAVLAPTAYQPVTSDIMNAFIQPRYTKLALAGAARNWEYAEYERRNIVGAMSRWAHAVPAYHGQEVTPMIAAFIDPSLSRLKATIQSHDPQAFAATFDALTTGCNQCHQATAHGFVVVKAPNPGAYSEQDFRSQP